MQKAGTLGLQLAPGGYSQESAVGVGGVGPSQGAKASGIDGFYPEVDELSPPGQQCGAWGWAGRGQRLMLSPGGQSLAMVLAMGMVSDSQHFLSQASLEPGAPQPATSSISTRGQAWRWPERRDL